MILIVFECSFKKSQTISVNPAYVGVCVCVCVCVCAEVAPDWTVLAVMYDQGVCPSNTAC